MEPTHSTRHRHNRPPTGTHRVQPPPLWDDPAWTRTAEYRWVRQTIPSHSARRFVDAVTGLHEISIRSRDLLDRIVEAMPVLTLTSTPVKRAEDEGPTELDEEYWTKGHYEERSLVTMLDCTAILDVLDGPHLTCGLPGHTDGAHRDPSGAWWSIDLAERKVSIDQVDPSTRALVKRAVTL